MIDVMRIEGKAATADCFAKIIEEEAIEQIRRMCDHEFTRGSRICIMPDVHKGKGCTIGTTMTVNGKAVPNIVGVDIGCGMYTVSLGKVDIDFIKMEFFDDDSGVKLDEEIEDPDWFVGQAGRCDDEGDFVEKDLVLMWRELDDLIPDTY